MYPWYRESAVSQFCGPAGSPMQTTIKTENGYNDCMLALDYAAQSKKAAFVWEGGQHGVGTGVGVGVGAGAASSGAHGKCGGGGPGAGQGGLVHWMSAVMAEHMNNVGNNHHDGIHYMWNGGVEQCGPHAKDMEYSWGRQTMAKQGYEAKMTTDQQVNHGVDDGRMEPPSVAALSLYGGAAGRTHSSSSSSASPPHPHGAATLIVPHPLAASKGQHPEQHHIVTHNGSGRKYQCKMCPSMGGPHAHTHTHTHAHHHPHPHAMYNPEKMQRAPLLNSQIFGSKSELQLHSQLHMREVKPYKCSQCSKTFANSSYLSQHTRIHLGIKPYRCEICQRKFTQLSHLQQHIRTHTGDKPYKCRHPGCNKAFSQLSNLQSHSRCHQTDKPYKCNSCYKCFSDEPSLLEHIPKHKESKHLKTHICQYCGKSYTQETYLTKHMQKHAERTDKRPPIIGIPRVTFDAPHYWPKVSPDTANTLVDAMGQQEYHHQNGGLQLEHLGGGEDHRTPGPPPPTPGAPSPGGYHDPKVNTSSASAFTPIQSMGLPGHHQHHLNHHQPYLSYNTLAFPSSKGQLQGLSPAGVQTSVAVEMPKSVTNNSFPNQLISLHQIRNYAHQPAAPTLMSAEHILTGLKDKTQ